MYEDNCKIMGVNGAVFGGLRIASNGDIIPKIKYNGDADVQISGDTLVYGDETFKAYIQLEWEQHGEIVHRYTSYVEVYNSDEFPDFFGVPSPIDGFEKFKIPCCDTKLSCVIECIENEDI